MSARVLLGLALLLFFIPLGSCGGENSESTEETARNSRDRQNASALRAASSRGVTSRDLSEDERDALAAAVSAYTLLEQGRGGTEQASSFDSSSFCELMSDEAQRQTVRYVRAASGVARDWDCESAIEHLVARSHHRGGREKPDRPRVVAVNTKGKRGTATIEQGTGSVTSIPLVREDGQWKLGSSGISR